MIITEAMNKCEVITSECVKGMLYLTNYDGASNQIEFDENGDLVSSNLMVKQIKEGKQTILEELK